MNQSYLLLNTKRQIFRGILLRLGLLDEFVLHSLKVCFVFVENRFGIFCKILPVFPGHSRSKIILHYATNGVNTLGKKMGLNA